MKNNILTASILSIILMIAFSCKKKNDSVAPIPVYDSTGFYQASIDANLTLQKANVFFDKTVSLNDSTKKITAIDLMNLFKDGDSNSLYSISNQNLKNNIDLYFQSFETASGHSFSPLDTLSKNGGVFVNQLFNKDGIALNGFLDKLILINSLYYKIDQIARPDTSINKTKLHQMLAYSGVNPSFPNTYSQVVGKSYDQYFGAFTAARDKNDGGGEYTQLKNTFAYLQDAVNKKDSSSKAGNILKVKRDIEFACMASAIHSLILSKKYLSKADSSVSYTDINMYLSKALFEYNQAQGFVLGFRYLQMSQRYISDNDLNSLCGKMNIDYQTYVASPLVIVRNYKNPTTITSITNAIKKIQLTYGFSDSDIVDFEIDWVEQQKR